ncbi:GDSL-like lipase/acylhydrolase family protein [Streptomyces sp. 1114.5]|uniref:SGNH/GDSL hydrolase family protein n=1 Tax=Streptomyces sp. 1114.5 TaxID=1938830 RepID=UPI000EB2FBA6|nr:SGNH/GDSL hydrolase family protein [Streptomyces sp. 1114.5]RKT18088.1 GDSL-like lipase/acylhydrolase family protein [Streptomyces sp. 1114.5]
MPRTVRPIVALTAGLAALLLAGCTAGSGSDGSQGKGFAGALPGRAPAGATPSPTPTPPPTGPYVALGDSYTAGMQIPPQTGEPRGCARSGVDYPALVAKGLGLSADRFRDVSCTGARTGDLTAAQNTGNGTNPAQLDALTPQTTLVTLGIGGNDAGFTDVVIECAKDSLVDAVKGVVQQTRAASPCRDHYASGDGTDEVQHRVDAAGVRLGQVLQDVKRRSPQARVYVVGYPTVFPADPSGCLPLLGRTVAVGDVAFLAEKQQQLNAMLRQRAQAAGAVFVDAAGPSVGHDMCAGEGERWVEPPFPVGGLAPIHPNAKGHEAVAGLVLKALKG